MAKNGWDRPLRHEIAVRLPELASAMQRGYDASGLGRKSGKLRAALGTIANYKVTRSASKTVARIVLTIRLVYARILDQGGRIPDRYPRVAKAMHYFAYGKEWFMRKVKGYDVRARDYTGAGVTEFMERHAISGGVDVRWSK